MEKIQRFDAQDSLAVDLEVYLKWGKVLECLGNGDSVEQAVPHGNAAPRLYASREDSDLIAYEQGPFGCTIQCINNLAQHIEYDEDFLVYTLHLNDSQLPTGFNNAGSVQVSTMGGRVYVGGIVLTLIGSVRRLELCKFVALLLSQ